MTDEPMKNKGGRPRGSSKHAKGDGLLLEKVADLLLKKPDLAPTTAMRQVLRNICKPHEDAAAIRRLQKKWKDTGHERLAEARHRRRDADAPSSRSNSMSGLAAAASAMSARYSAMDTTALSSAAQQAKQSLSMIEKYKVMLEGPAGSATNQALESIRRMQQEERDLVRGISGSACEALAITKGLGLQFSAASAIADVLRKDAEYQKQIVDALDSMREYRGIGGF